MSLIVTGEKIQQLCDIYLGNEEDFIYNPNINKEITKHLYLNNINNFINNPYRIFCYTHNINILSQKIHFFQNNFILITHNSDTEIRETNEVLKILHFSKMLKWFGQNICFEHPKLYFLPIGLANSQWSRGNICIFNDIKNLTITKSNNVYFNFNINTNVTKRKHCYDSLIHKLQWLDNLEPVENFKRLRTYKFCICPEGNGVDTHRLWECLYLKVIPIVIKSNFTNILLNQNIPLVVLDDWEQFDLNNLNYDVCMFDTANLKKILHFDNYLLHLC
jgi:hypothetical protein